MKRTALALIVASLFVISCNNSGTKTEVKSSDSTQVIVDTTLVVDSVKLVK